MDIKKIVETKFIWTNENLYVSFLDIDIMETLTLGISKVKTISALELIWSWAESYAIDEEMDLNRYNWFLDHISKAINQQRIKIMSILE